MPSGWISKKNRIAIYQRDQYICSYCSCYVLQCGNKTLPMQIAYMRAFKHSIATLDHVIPKGDHIVTACNRCNASKRHELVQSFTLRKGYELPRAMYESQKR
jgi:5-methylcytosine-specific restriction endonuclease McrA